MPQMRAGPGASAPSVLTGHPFDPTNLELVVASIDTFPEPPGHSGADDSAGPVRTLRD
jgi:hypothetical protein